MAAALAVGIWATIPLLLVIGALRARKGGQR